MDIGTLDGPRAVIETRFARVERLWNDARKLSPALHEIGSVDRFQLVARFARLDRQLLKEDVATIRAGRLAQIPQGAMGEMRVIRGEIGKKRAYIALRKLFSTAATAIQRIKPVLLMSPVSVAQFLPPGALTFDLLVIDEASQVRPEDALGALRALIKSLWLAIRSSSRRLLSSIAYRLTRITGTKKTNLPTLIFWAEPQKSTIWKASSAFARHAVSIRGCYAGTIGHAIRR
jgi:hypothetical protein